LTEVSEGLASSIIMAIIALMTQAVCFMNFFTPSMHVSGQYFKTGHNRFFPF
jgi:hypothetical protein